MSAQRYATRPQVTGSAMASKEEGIFCDICTSNSNSCYWSCDVCNDGEWGFCNSCLHRGSHCTHPLSAKRFIQYDPEHVGNVVVQNLTIDITCNICRRIIPTGLEFLHCPDCNGGNYDVCYPCYNKLIVEGKISQQDGLHWRKCENGHRMMVVTHISDSVDDETEKQFRIVTQNVVGGWHTKDEDVKQLSQSVKQGISSESTQAQAAHAQSQEETIQDGWTWQDPTSGTWKHLRRPHTSNSTLQPQTQYQDRASLPVPNTNTLSHLHQQRRRTPSPSYPNFNPNPNPNPNPHVEKQPTTQTAIWTRVPEESVQDELTFPKRAVIESVFGINEDWAWGVYCRKGGLFPRGFCR